MSLRNNLNPPQNEKGENILTVKFIKKTCIKKEGMFTTPELNTKLYLNYFGFHKIESLDLYTNLKCLFLDSNWIERIENLEKNTNLISLYLQNNIIKRIENLDSLINLKIIWLNANQIRKIEGLSKLVNL